MAEITKITMKFGKKTIELSIEEVKEFRKALNDLLEQKIDYVPYYPSCPSYPGIGYPPQTWYSTNGNTEASLNP